MPNRSLESEDRCDSFFTTSGTRPVPGPPFICPCPAPAICAATPRPRGHHPVHQVPRPGHRRPDRGRHGLDPHRPGQPGRGDRRIARPLLDLPVQVRHELDQPVHADRAQAGERLPRRAARRGRALPLFRDRHQAADHRARARGAVACSSCTCRSSSATATTSCATCTSWSSTSHQAGDRRRRLQHLLGRARDLPVHAGRRSAQRQRTGLPSYPGRRPRKELDFVLYSRRHRGRRSSTFPTCASPIIGR